MSKPYYFVMAHGDLDSETSGGFGDLVGIFDTYENAIESLKSVRPWFDKSIYKFENGVLEEIIEKHETEMTRLNYEEWLNNQ